MPDDPKVHIYTVSELNRAIKRLLSGAYADIWLEGEVSNLRRPTSGHVYFTLKDEGAQVRAVAFRGVAGSLRFDIEDGLQIVVRGEVTVYEPRGDYQIIVGHAEPKGIGALQLAFEQLKARLADEGLFDPERKVPLPVLPARIGVVTSPTGAAFRDILNVIGRRFPKVSIVLAPAKVQGEGAAEEIARGIRMLNGLGDIDVMIVGRGGGSLEDLWAFNEEVVARAIAGSSVPVISAVGHEIDFVIADFVADVRAPTPSAAAELVVGEYEAMARHLLDLSAALPAQLRVQIDAMRAKVDSIRRGYAFLAVVDRVRQLQMRADELGEQLLREGRRGVELHRRSLSAAAGKLDALSPLAVLGRGYAAVYGLRQAAVVRSHRELRKGDDVDVTLGRGSFRASVTSTSEEAFPWRKR